MFKSILEKMFNAAMALNRSNILDLIEIAPDAKILDLGCDTGSWSRALAQKARSRQLFGIEVVPDRASIASQNGVQVTMADITNGLPYADASFDIIHANQVIEHLSDLDLFMAEIYRVLKKGGYVILSTENGSSWHNIFAAVMGWQIFSLTNMSDRSAGIGNPLAVHRHNTGHMKSWTHKTIFNFRGLVEFVGAHGFSDIKVSGAGYYPFPACFGKIDKRHAHFITIRGTK